jgi:hypothetical protein
MRDGGAEEEVVSSELVVERVLVKGDQGMRGRGVDKMMVSI